MALRKNSDDRLIEVQAVFGETRTKSSFVLYSTVANITTPSPYFRTAFPTIHLKILASASVWLPPRGLV